MASFGLDIFTQPVVGRKRCDKYSGTDSEGSVSKYCSKMKEWFCRKAGHGPDGWMVGPEVDHTSLMVTTRNKVLKTPGIRFKKTRNKE